MMNPAKRIRRLLTVVLVLTGLVVAGYFLFAKFLADRDAAQGLHPADREVIRRVQKLPYSQKQTFTAEELEEMRKKGNLPQGQNPSIPTPMQPLGTDAAQRSLKTVEEINRINEMNRRLIEQQQKNQR